MTWWNRKPKTSDTVVYDPESSSVGTYSVPADAAVPKYYVPRTLIPCDDPKKRRKKQTGYEWYEWVHGGEGVPWRINTKKFNAMLMNGWEIVDICNSLTLLKRPTFVHYLDTPKRKKTK